MTPTNKFTETVNAAAPEKKVSSQPNGNHEEPLLNGSLENREVVLSKINYLQKWAYNEGEQEKNS